MPLTQAWHSDFTFAVEPPSVSILMARILPPVGGDTMFANQQLAYDTLSDTMKGIVGRLRAFHQGTVSYAERQGIPLSQIEAVHPVVRTHPETGRRSLYVNAVYTKRIVGMSEEESAPLLAFLFEHAVRPEFTYRHRWLEGDLLMWDNRAVQHAVIGDVGGAERVLHRLTLKGDAPR
jgi:taurine dioxygenase